MIGAIADWFAVVALFRRPLGLPIPHTAIVPANKSRIGANLADFLCSNFLGTQQVLAKLREFGPADRLADWLADPGARAAHRAAPDGRGTLGRRNARRRARAPLRRRRDVAVLARIDVAPLAGQLLDVLTANRRLPGAARRRAAAGRPAPRRRCGARADRATDRRRSQRAALRRPRLDGRRLRGGAQDRRRGRAHRRRDGRRPGAPAARALRRGDGRVRRAAEDGPGAAGARRDAEAGGARAHPQLAAYLQEHLERRAGVAARRPARATTRRSARASPTPPQRWASGCAPTPRCGSGSTRRSSTPRRAGSTATAKTSAATSSSASTRGTRRNSPTNSSATSAATCSTCASTARWSAG